MLTITGLHVTVEKKDVLSGVDLRVGRGEVHALMGPNGSGKSSLALTLSGHPAYTATKGTVRFLRKNLLAMSVPERARAGLFLAFQAPVAIPGVTVFTFLRQAYEAMGATSVDVVAFKKRLVSLLSDVGLDETFLGRYVHDGFSGGERKKLEVLQVLLFAPKMVVLDEVDSGLDVDSLKLVAAHVRTLVSEKSLAVLVISHYRRLLEYLEPDFVHVMKGGVIVQEGDRMLAEEIEHKGYGGAGT